MKLRLHLSGKGGSQSPISSPLLGRAFGPSLWPGRWVQGRCASAVPSWGLQRPTPTPTKPPCAARRSLGPRPVASVLAALEMV